MHVMQLIRTHVLYLHQIIEKNCKKKTQKTNIPELHLLSYYGDITGPHELNLRNKCIEEIQSHFQSWRSNANTLKSSGSEQKDTSDAYTNTATICQTMFEETNIEIMHISHYSFEFVLNISNTPFLDDYKLDDMDKTANYYLVGTYQQSKFDDYFDEFVTIGLTKSIRYTQNPTLYSFYIDDFIQDLYKILMNTSWYDDTCNLPPLLWYNIAQYTMDCLLPVQYTRSDDDEIILNDGALHLFLTGDLNPYRNGNDDNNKTNDDSGDMKTDRNGIIDSKLEIIGNIFVDLGRIVYKQYNSNKNAKQIKSEYDEWKKHGYKKRAHLKPSNMNKLTQKLTIHQKKRNVANDIETINKLEYLYYKNPNFKLKFSTKSSTIQSFKKLFSSFGSSNKLKKNKHSKTETYAYSFHPTMPTMSRKRSESATISRAHTAPFNASKKGKNKKKKKKVSKKRKNRKKRNVLNDIDSNVNNDDNIGNIKELSSLPIFTASGASSGRSTSSMERAKSTPNPPVKRNRKYSHPRKNHSNQFITMNMMKKQQSDGCQNDDDQIPDTTLGETQSAYSAVSKQKGQRLQPTLNKPQKTNGHNMAYSHGSNEIYFLDYQTSNDPYSSMESVDIGNKSSNIKPKHIRQESSTIMKVKDDIKRAYKEYESEKGKIPTDIQSFVTYCKKRRNIKKANWTLCQYVMKEMKNGGIVYL